MAPRIIHFNILAVTALIATVFPRGQVFAVETYSEKTTILAEIAVQYTVIGKSQQAIKILDQALPLTKAITNQCFKANPLVKVALGYIQAGQEAKGKQLLTEAIQIAHTQTLKNCSGSATSPDESLLNRAKEYAEAGYYDFAVEIITRVNNPIFTPTTMAEIAVDYAKAGEVNKATQVVNQAIEIAQRNDHALYRTMTLVSIAVYLSEGGLTKQVPQVLERAYESASAINEAQSRDNAAMKVYHLQTIAKLFAEVAEKHRAIEILDQTLPKIRTLPGKPFSLEKSNQLVEIAIQYAALEQKNKAVSTLAEAQTVVQAISINEAQSKNNALVQVASGYAEIGNFDQAQQIARSINSVDKKEHALGKIALAYAEAGYSDQAVKLAKSMANRNDTFIEIAKHYIEIGQNDRALRFVQQWNVLGIKSEVALAFLQAGQPDQALTLVQKWKLEGLGFMPEIALAYVKAGQPRRALQILEPNPEYNREGIFTEIARGFAKQGQFDQALQVAQTLTDKGEKANALTAIAEQYLARKPDNKGLIQKIFSLLTNSLNSLFGSSNKDKADDLLDQALQVAQSIAPKD